MPASDSIVRQLRIGIAAGLGLIRQNTTFNVLQSGSDCGQFQSATRNQPGFELFFETPLSAQSSFWYLARAGFAHGTLELFSNNISEEARQNGQTYFVVRRHHLTAPVSAVKLSAGGGWELIPGLRLQAAPTLTVLSVGQQKVVEELVDPPGAEFTENGETTRPVVDGATAVGFRSLVPGLDIGIGERIPIGERLAVHPEVRANLQFGSIASNVSWNETGFQFLLGISYDFSSRPKQVEPAIVENHPQDPAVKPVETSEQSDITAKIVAYGEDEQGHLYENPRIEIEEAPWVESVPIIPAVFFDSASAAIAHRYIQLRTPESASRFQVDSLLGITPLEIHWQLLNVIGERMRANPAKRLTITGTVSADEAGDDAQALGITRAQAVAQYLIEIWKIAPGRINVKFDTHPATAAPEETPEGREENRRAEIRFDDEEIARPVIIHRLATIASPPAVRFFPNVESVAPVVDWYVSVMQGDKELLRFEGTGGDSNGVRQEKQWSLSDLRVTRDLTPIRYRLIVHDSLGQEASDEGEFRVVESTHRVTAESEGKHTEVAEFSIVGFNYSSAELLPRHLAQLQDIASAISDGAEVTITGYTDRVGDADRNRQLSLDRAKAVQGALRAIRQRMGNVAPVSMSVHGVGNEQEVYNNDLPEGRLLSRMVQITISRKVEK